MKYKKFIEDKFLIDDSKSGRLVPFIFNPVQNQYYEDLIRDYDIENRGITQPIRENILKARREGFSSLILAIFAADDILQDNPTETTVLSYKDEATKTFRRRYRNYILSYFAQKMGLTKEQIADNVNLLEDVASKVLLVDSTEFILAHNKAHFYCGTASAKVGGRGGVLHKCLFSEMAFYPDTDKISAAEMIEATMRQVDIKSGWIFGESTENGIGTYQHKLWVAAKKGVSRFINRFYGWPLFYTPEEYSKIESEYVDKDALRRDYPKTEEDLFKGTMKNFTSDAEISRLVNAKSNKEIVYWLELRHENGIDAVETLASTLEMLVGEHRGHALYVGIDEAKDVDATVMTVIKDSRRDLRGGVKGIAIDTTRGDFIADWFERNTNFSIERVKFSRGSKSIMYTNMQVIIADTLTALPELKVGLEEYTSDEAKHFYTQMMALEKEIIGNMLVVHHPKGNCGGSDHDYDECEAHDDYCDSWALAEHMFIQLNGPVKRNKKAVVPTIPNAVDKLLNRSMKSDRASYGSGDDFES